MNITSSSFLAKDIMNQHARPLQQGVRLGKDLALQFVSGLFSSVDGLL